MDDANYQCLLRLVVRALCQCLRCSEEDAVRAAGTSALTQMVHDIRTLIIPAAGGLRAARKKDGAIDEYVREWVEEREALVMRPTTRATTPSTRRPYQQRMAPPPRPRGRVRNTYPKSPQMRPLEAPTDLIGHFSLPISVHTETEYFVFIESFSLTL